MIDFNTEPYNDDFDENNKFYRILFRPSFAVQARELTQLQTILQNQIQRHGDHIFKQGAMVIPGQCSVETITNTNKGADYVKLQPLYNGVAVETFISSLKGATIVGSSGIAAQIYHIENLESTEPTTIYVRYQDSGTDGVTKTFSNNEVITTEDGSYAFQAFSTAATGKGSLATIQRGVYYVNGHFCLVEEQSIVLDKYTNTPSYRVGLLATEYVVTPEENETLLDNAQNSYNFAAPGAHRYSIELTLTKIGIDSVSDQDFVELIRVLNGRVKTIVDTTLYNEIGKELARRTYDESGDYTVREFPIDVREYRDNNRGAWAKSTVYLTGDIITSNGNTYVAKNSGTSSSIDNSNPTHTSGTVIDGTNGIYWEYNPTPYYNRGINKPPAQTALGAEDIATQRANEAKLAIGLEAGKAYIRGYEVEKDSTTYITVNKSRDYQQAAAAVIPATVGNYILVTNVNNAPPTETLERVTLYNRVTGSSGRGSIPSGAQIVGYARARFMEWHDILPFGYSSIYKLGLFDIQMNAGYDFARDVKSLYATSTGGSADPNLAFTADINPITLSTNTLDGTITAAGTGVTGTGTAFTSQLRAGDYINVAGAVYRVASITNATSLTLDTSLTATGSKFTRAETQIQEPTNSSLLFALPFNYIRSVRKNGDPNTNYWPDLASSGTTDVTYQVYQKFTQTASGTTVTLSTSGTFASAAETDNYICIDNDATVGGTIFVPASITVSGSTATISVAATTANGGDNTNRSGRSITVIAAVIKNGSEKTKTLTPYTGIQSGNVFNTAQTAQQPVILLEHADIFRLKSVKMAPAVAFGGTPTYAQYTVDITDRYDFDNGQRSTHYDLGRLILKQSYTVPSNPIIVEYEYFEHGTGDYFSVNSYKNASTGTTIPDYKDIPDFLRDSLDFRPKVANKSGGTVRNFIGTGSSIPGVPKRGVDITAYFTYYLGRKDKILLDFSGKFSSITGVPSLTPGEPEAPSIGMVLYNLTYQPYTIDTTKDSIRAEKIENKRYTMRDIGKLEKRIDNLEYYTSLSLLETETQALKIPDSVTGLDRMKNGFIVDNFTSTQLADTASQDYVCSIDMEKGELRPFYTMYNSKLLEKNTLTAQRTASGYKLSGDIITLPIIDNPVLVKQEYASRLENINPFAIFTFLGNTTINPPSDDWFETTRIPDLIQNIEGNYNAVRDAAIKAGQIGQNGLGTVWSAWQTEWVGKPITQNVTFTNASGTRSVNSSASGQDVNVNFGSAAGFGLRSTVVEVTAQQTGFSRFGLQTSLVQKVDFETVGDRVVSSAVIPYIRSRNVLVQSKGLKPNTRFYAYFDDIDISSYITPARKMVYTTVSGTFDDSTNVGGNTNETKRRINGDSQVCLNKGDVITNNAGTAWAVVVGTATTPAGQKVLYLSNINGTFANGQTINGSVSGAVGTVVSIDAQPTILQTNDSGDLQFLFNIPNTDSAQFRTGSRELKLVDVATANGQWTSRGRAVYRAEGTLETKQTTINAVRNAELVREMLTDSKTVWNTDARIISDQDLSPQWYDPLAQSFLVQSKGGAFITKIDVFFATKDSSMPVTMEIREMVNGYPGKNVLPFSRVTLKPEQVNLSGTTVTLDGADYPTYDTPTTFTFPAPVYVQDNQEYCFVLSSDSNNYQVWISNMGDSIPGSPGRTISQQPYNGVMFKSQNASTWTAEQNQDIKFTIYRAKFDTSVTGTVDFVNDINPYQTLENNPFQTVTGTNTVRVWHWDHGMSDGSKVNIKGVSAAVNGIPAAELMGEKTITNIETDSYTITTTTNATVTGYGGGNAVQATKNIQYDVILPSIEMQNFSDTTTTFGIKTTSGRSVDGNQTPYIVDSYTTACLNKENNFFFSPRVIASEINENTFMAGVDSVTFTVGMKSTNDAVSPVIDTARASLITINNKVNNPTETNTNVAALDIKTIFTGATGAFNFANIGTLWTSGGSVTAGTQYYFESRLYTAVQSGTFGSAAPIHTYGRASNGTAVLEYAGNPGSIQSTNATIRNLMPNLAVGKYITVSGTTSNNGTFLVTGYSDDGTTGRIVINNYISTTENSVSGSTVQLRELFVDDIASVGSSTYSKYVTNPIKLNFSSTFARIRFACNVPNGADLQLYYKTSVGDTKQLSTTKYTLATPKNVNGIPKVELGDETFYDVDYDLENMTPFDGIVVKLVMKSTNSCLVPRIKDLRVIACA